MSGVTFWTGPANLAQVGPYAVVPGTGGHAVPCVGAQGSPICRDLAWQWRDADGRRLPSLMRRLGVDPYAPGDVFLCAFSAGGPLVRELVSAPADRALVRLTYFADATYSDGWIRGKPILSQQLVELAEASTTSPNRMMVATAGESPNYDKPSAAQVLDELRAQLEQKLGPFEDVPEFQAFDPTPIWAARRGNLVLARYGLSPLGHAGHATDLAGRVISRFVVPWYQNGMGLPGASGGSGSGGASGGSGGSSGSGGGQQVVPTDEDGGSSDLWWQLGVMGLGVVTAMLIYRLIFGDKP